MSGLIRGYTRHLTPVSPGAARTDPLDRGLVIDYRFEPASGLVLPDYSGRGYRGVVTGATWVATHYGLALDFNGAGNEVDIPAAAKPTGPLTVEVFLRPDSWTSLDAVFGGRGLGGAGDQGGIAFTYWGPGDEFWFDIYDVNSRASASLLAGVTDIPTGQWTHLVCLWEGTTAVDAIKIYLNGLFSSSGNSALVSQPLVWNYDFELANSDRNATFDGQIALFRLYDRVLSAGEIWQRRHLCLRRAQAMTQVWMMPQGRSPVIRIPRHPAAYNTLAIY